MPSIMIENEPCGADDIAAYLKQRLCKSRDIKIKDASDAKGSFTAISYADHEASCELLSAGIADYIIRYREMALLRRIVNKNYGYFSPQEKNDIYYIASEKIHAFQNRKQMIKNHILEYLKRNQLLCITGFINFRLKEYFRELEYVVDTAVEAFLAKKEYDEFLELLKFFVSIQENRAELLHVVAVDDGYRIYHADQTEITNQCYLEFVHEFPYRSINTDDFLISTLVNLAPKKVILHHTEQMKNKELLQTIQCVFGDGAIMCRGCSICGRQDLTDRNIPDLHFTQNPI